MTLQWPVQLADGDLVLRPLGRKDAEAWHRLRRANADWLRPWEATLPQPDPSVPTTYGGMIRGYRRDAKAGRSLSLGLDHAGSLVGQVTLGGISWGSLRSAYIGYWISQAVAGRGLMPRAVALLSDYALTEVGLHRLEINIRPENTASLRVVAKLGFRVEGERHAYLHIDGDWRDHVTYVMLAEELPPGGLLARLAHRTHQRTD
jgi:ribosomal-protein-alanine N-acetyltransferase